MARAADQAHDVIYANQQGRVTIPSPLRRATGVEPGVPLVAYEEDGKVVIETREHLADRIRREVAASWTGPDGSVVDELIADRRAAAAAEAADHENVEGDQ